MMNEARADHTWRHIAAWLMAVMTLAACSQGDDPVTPPEIPGTESKAIGFGGGR